MQHITLVGLGIMGNGMGHNLLKAGYPLTVYNRTQAKTEGLVSAGATSAATPRVAAQNADVVISIVANDEASRAVWLGADGVLAGVRPNTLLIESSTLSPAWIRELAGLAEAKQCRLIDAPVGGSKPQAEGGQLTFFVGGERADLDHVAAILDVLGQRTNYLGPIGSGATMKLVNNLMGGVQVAALGEALALAEQAGLNVQQVADLLSNGAPGSPIVKTKAPGIVAHDYPTNFALRWMHKDLSYALAEGERHHLSLTTVAAARNLYQQGIERGLADEDFAAVAETVRTAEQ
ncbi:MAG: NAD(P)-dependent oxidoreductase [Herpetosiphonaceae bacterium]|nr:NAD(P)-dependent oxidoreductase [Herpetosiphonaceae bacterium]